MSQLGKIFLGFVVSLLALTLLHGALNQGWFQTRRDRLTIAHLPVT